MTVDSSTLLPLGGVLTVLSAVIAAVRLYDRRDTQQQVMQVRLESAERRLEVIEAWSKTSDANFTQLTLEIKTDLAAIKQRLGIDRTV